jgi:type VI protein secretion system component VasF
MSPRDAPADVFAAARPFFREVLTQKASARLLNEQTRTLAPEDVAARVRAMQNSLLSLLRHEPGRDPVSEEVRHALAAFADDALLSFDWSGQALWAREPLAAALAAGRLPPRLADRIDALLQRNSAADVPLGLVYLTALSLGFVGADDTERTALRRRREELALFVARHDPVPAPYSRHVCPDAYTRTVRPPIERTRDAAPLWRAVAGGVLLFLLLSHAVWLYITGDLRTLTERVVAMAHR